MLPIFCPDWWGLHINGGTLSGSGAINGSIVNGATVYPGDPITLTINGNYTQKDGGTPPSPINTTPEPGSLFLFGTGLLGLAWAARRKLQAPAV